MAGGQLVKVGRRTRTWAAALAIAVVCLGTPATREWTLFALTLGDTMQPKGWPFAEPWRDWDRPTEPRELAAYDHAHALQLPASLPRTVPFSFSRHLLSNRWHTAVAYYEHLCRTEAGEFIFRRVQNVAGLYQMRPMPLRTNALLRDRYGFEDPADWSLGEADGSPMLFMGGPSSGFRFFESLRAPEAIADRYVRRRWTGPSLAERTRPERFWRYFDFDETHGYENRTAHFEQTDEIRARYAYTWRGIRRDRDREFGIAGGELIVLDVVTGEILGVRRSFAIARQHGKKLDWEFAAFCPGNLRRDGRERRLNKIGYPFTFVRQVIDPILFDENSMKF